MKLVASGVSVKLTPFSIFNKINTMTNLQHAVITFIMKDCGAIRYSCGVDWLFMARDEAGPPVTNIIVGMTTSQREKIAKALMTLTKSTSFQGYVYPHAKSEMYRYGMITEY